MVSQVKITQRIPAAVDVDDYYPAKELSTRHLLNVQILEIASSLTLSESVELHIAYVWNAMGESMMRGSFMTKSEGEIIKYVDETRRQCNQKLNLLMDEVIGKLGRDTFDYIEPKTHLLKGSPRKNVPEFSEKIKADLVVMGTVARTGIPDFFMGNTAESILNQLNCSVLAIKPSGFKTPVTLEAK